MAASIKRTAQIAFQEEGEIRTASKKKRLRNKTGPKDVAPKSTSIVTEPIKPHLAQESSLSKAFEVAKDVSNITELEHRIPAPSPTDRDDVASHVTGPVSAKKKRRKDHHEGQITDVSKDLRKPKKGSMGWTMSLATGGIFIEHDPILTTDGQFLILPTQDRVHVYSAPTSLLVRSIQMKEGEVIIGCAMALTSSKVLTTITRRGTLFKHDITTGAKVGQWKIGSGFQCPISIPTGTGGEHFLAVRSNEAHDDELMLLSTLENGKVESKDLIRKSKLHARIFSSADGATLVLCGPRTIHVGVWTGIGAPSYHWHDIPVSGSIVSFDVFVSQKASPLSKGMMTMNVAVGIESGPIFVYDDMLPKLMKMVKGGQKPEFSPRKLHWHRSSPRSVKWSRDGNYIISGGDETVLVIWQLDTNQQQFLPHLSTTILNITVSSTGSSYAIRLGDNSVMVLSTADLLPSTNVTGLSLPSLSKHRCPLLLHPSNPSLLLAAVPVRPLGRDNGNAKTHLQTYDIDSNVQLSRQALTRNVTTAVNISPDGQPIQEPSINHLQISHDGNWLATVDTWSPNSSDLQSLYLNQEDMSVRHGHTETVLRFWRWDESESSWEMVTRVDEPHTACKHSVLGLASNPSLSEFCTIGSDGLIKVWQPKRRVRDGVQVRNRDGDVLFTWTCSRSLQVEKDQTSTLSHGTVIYSEDGSVLVASWSRSQRQVRIIDRFTGTLKLSLPNLISEGPATTAVIGRYLVCLSNRLSVFDMVTLQTTFDIGITRNHGAILATNGRSNTFVVALNSMEKGGSTLISIFDVGNPEKGSLDDFELPTQIHGVLPDSTNQGFVIIDKDCKIRKLVAPGGTSNPSLSLLRIADAADTSASKSLEDVFGRDRLITNEASGHHLLLESGDRAQSLVDILAVPSTSVQPGVGELFDRVSRAVSGAQVQAAG